MTSLSCILFHSPIIIIIDMQLNINVYSDVKYLTAYKYCIKIVGNILMHIAFNITGTLIDFNQSSYCVAERDGHINIHIIMIIEQCYIVHLIKVKFRYGNSNKVFSETWCTISSD